MGDGKQLFIDSVENDKLAPNAVAGSASGASGDNVIEAASIDTADLALDAVDNTILDLAGTYDFGGGGGDVQVADTPAGPSSATNKNYVDGVAQGLKIKESVVAATTGPLTLATDFENGDTLDTSVTLTTGDRILIKDQASGVENGIYVVQASGAPVRAADLPAADNARSIFVFIEEGTVNADTGWVCTNDAGSDVVGTDALAFTQFTGAGTYTGGNGIDVSGTTISADLAAPGAGTGGLEFVGIEMAVDAGNGIELTAGGVAVEPYSGADTSVAPLTVDGDGAGVDTDDVTIEHAAGVLNVKADGIGATELDETDTYDFTGGSVDVATQAAGNNSTKAASTAYVQGEVAQATAGDKELTPAVTAGNYSTTGITISATPKGYVGVAINGEWYTVGNGVRTKDCYFSNDGGATARAISAIVSGDTLYWNGPQVTPPFELAATDRVDLHYEV